MTLSTIDVAVLCGARTRNETPRVLTLINGRPYIEWLISRLKIYGVRRIVMCAGYLSEKILAWQMDRPADGIEIVVSVEPKQDGALGALFHARDKLKSDNVLIVNDDTLCNADLREFVKFHGERMGVSVLYARKLGNPKYQNACHYLMSFAYLDSLLKRNRRGSLAEATRERMVLNCGVFYDIESDDDAEAFLESMLEAA
jgi:NDP-sugar pyrophosphorylase family protein